MKQQFLIKKIESDGYERLAYIEALNSNLQGWAHFIQHDEYIEDGNESVKNGRGKIIEGIVKIDLVTEWYKHTSEEEKGFNQPINNSSHIIANGLVKEIKDEYTVICSIDELGISIIVEFENRASLDIGDNIQIVGSLEIEIE